MAMAKDRVGSKRVYGTRARHRREQKKRIQIDYTGEHCKHNYTNLRGLIFLINGSGNVSSLSYYM